MAFIAFIIFTNWSQLLCTHIPSGRTYAWNSGHLQNENNECSFTSLASLLASGGILSHAYMEGLLQCGITLCWAPTQPGQQMTIIETGPLPSTITVFPGVFTEFPVLQTGCSMVNLNITVFKYPATNIHKWLTVLGASYFAKVTQK